MPEDKSAEVSVPAAAGKSVVEKKAPAKPAVRKPAATKQPVVKAAAAKQAPAKSAAPKLSKLDETKAKNKKALAEALAKAQAVKFAQPQAVPPVTKAKAKAKAKAAKGGRKQKLVRHAFSMPEVLSPARGGVSVPRFSGCIEPSGRPRGSKRSEPMSIRVQIPTALRRLTGGAAEQVQVRAPVAARVLKVLHESEGAVAAGQPLLEIGNPSSLEVEVEVLSTHAVKIAPGSKVILDRWGGDRPVEGTVRVVEPSGYTKISALGVEEQRVRVIVDFTSPHEAWARLGDGYRVEARFVLWEGQDVLQLPTSALFRHGKGWAAFRLEGRRARLTPVEIGQRAGLVTQVLSGLKAGDRVVAHPDETIRDGGRVKPR